MLLKTTLTCLIVGLMLVAPSQPARAQSNSVCRQEAEYQDENADGQPDAMVFSCQFAPDTQDQLTVYKQSGSINKDLPWQNNIAFENETWVFDHGKKGNASLIILFRKEEGSLVAELYDDRNADGEVAYSVKNGKVEITENPFWTVQVLAPDGWWIREGSLNYNLHIRVDGDVEGMFMMEAYRNSLETDGKPDYDIKIYDQNNNGNPELDERRILTDWLQEAVGLQTQMMVNWEDDELPISGGFSLWPFLDLAHEQASGSRVDKGYQITPPPIKFSPSSGRIEAVGEFVASRGGETNCFYYSAIPWVAGKINETDFESPFCFYDLAQDGDRVPELQIRAEYWPPYDKNFQKGYVSEAYESIRYSWDQENSQTWRYAVGLVGRHLIDSTVTFGDMEVLSIPYEEFPGWVTGRDWDMAVFSEFTGKQYWTSEGNYYVSYPGTLKYEDYFTGHSENKPSPVYEPDVNFRMEWAMDHNSQPYLYFSPLDQRLHLLGAGGGAWKVDENHTIQYQNLSGGDYIEQWVSVVDGQPEKSLIVLNNFIMLEEKNTVSILLSESPKSRFTTLPPTNHQEWEKLGADLEPVEPDFAPDDFKSMVEQFSEIPNSIIGASLRDFRMQTAGFRFLLKLDDGFEVNGEDLLDLKDVASGEYVVNYDGVFQLKPLTPAAIQVIFASSSSMDLPTALTGHNLKVMLQNSGLEDAHRVMVTTRMVGPNEETLASNMQILPVLAGEDAAVYIPWTPPAAGNWTIRAQAVQLDERLLVQEDAVTIEHAVSVLPARGTDQVQEVSAMGVVQPVQLAALILALIAACAGTMVAFGRAAFGKSE